MLKVLVSIPGTETRESFIPPDIVAQLNKYIKEQNNIPLIFTPHCADSSLV